MMRSLDHCVLPVASLDDARRRLTELGFTVAPDGVHPFGTSNACVYFEDGTFLEALAVGDPDAVTEAIAAGNVFVGRDAAYRERVGHDGFSALVFRSGDADADHEDFVALGMSAGSRLNFARPFVDAEGRADEARFRLAFAGEPGSPDALFFSCERASAPKVDRRALERHANGATGIREIVMTAAEPSAHCAFLAALSGAPAAPFGAGFCFRLAAARLTLMPPKSFADAFGAAPDGDPSLRFRAIVLGVPDLAKVAGSGRVTIQRRVVAPPQEGQGALLAFENP